MEETNRHSKLNIRVAREGSNTTDTNISVEDITESLDNSPIWPAHVAEIREEMTDDKKKDPGNRHKNP